MAKLKVRSNQGSLFDVPEPAYCYDADDDMTTKMAKFIIERHKIFLRRQRGDAKPWTTDPILRDNRFCNIYRELDTVSVWIRDNVITKYEDNPNLWFMLAISRLINWPDTLQELMDGKAWPIKTWNPDLAFKILDAKAKRKEKVITGAYLINSVPPKDANPKDRRKVYYIPYFGLTPMWEARKEIAPVFKTTLTDSVNTLKQFHGWSNFMSYQVVVDLTYSDQWLMNAPDYNTFNSPGPGTQRGLSRYFTGGIGGGLDKKELNKLIIQQRKEVNAKLKELLPSKLITKDFSTGFETISLSNMSNSNCEFDKHQRVFLGESKMRSKYNGAK